MKNKGFFGIGCLNMKTHHNYGTLFRTAQIMDADFIFLIGCRFKRQSSDTMNSSKHLPLYVYDSIQQFNSNRPHGCQLVGIELLDSAVPIKEYEHPKQAAYLLGAEDHGLTKEAISLCQDIICLPGKRSMNVSVAGSIVLYDRVNKSN